MAQMEVHRSFPTETLCCVGTSTACTCLILRFLFSGVILAVVFIRMKKDEGKDNIENPKSPEARPLRS